MTAALSLYLDALRFGAALTVFVSHYSTGRISGGLFWQIEHYGRTAVLVFFVLSGFVIAWVSETRERTFEEYGLSRVARLYSVIIPAFILTAALDIGGKAIDPTLYGPEWGHSMAHPAVGYALSAVFLGESWRIRVPPRLQRPLLVAQLRGLVLRLIRRRRISAGATADSSHHRGRADGRTENFVPVSRVADGGCGMAMAS